LLDQPVRQMAANESGSTNDESAHRADIPEAPLCSNLGACAGVEAGRASDFADRAPGG